MYILLKHQETSTGLDISAGEKGALTANLTFTTPTTTVKGSALSELTKVEVYRNETKIASLDNNLPIGKKIKVEDKDIPVLYLLHGDGGK